MKGLKFHIAWGLGRWKSSPICKWKKKSCLVWDGRYWYYYYAWKLFIICFHAFQVIQSDGLTWKLVFIDEDKAQGRAPPIFQRILRSNVFHISVLLLVQMNAFTAASLTFDHNKIDPDHKLDRFYYAEVSQTLFLY